jgi:hypothetical protein
MSETDAAAETVTPGMQTPSIDEIESKIAHDLVRKALIVAPIVMLGVGLWRGVDAAAAVLLAFAIIIANFLANAAILGWTARNNPSALQGVALLSFLTRLVIITAIGVGVKALDIVDWPVFCITLVASYFVLLLWELRSISFTMASPGLKPKPDPDWE